MHTDKKVSVPLYSIAHVEHALYFARHCCSECECQMCSSGTPFRTSCKQVMLAGMSGFKATTKMHSKPSSY